MGDVVKTAKDSIKDWGAKDWLTVATGIPFSERALDPGKLYMTDPIEPPEPPPEYTPPLEAQKDKRKRAGRQSTILTGSMSEASTYRPTLLGQ